MITIKKSGNKVIIEAELDGKNLSSSGKNINLATTNGFTTVPEDSNIRVSLNIIKSIKAK
jgi:hypothetical protein